MKAVCFTGHRKIRTDTEALKNELDFAIETAILKGATFFYCGGALGFDTLAADAVIRAREKHPDITLNLVLPCRNEFQTAKWNDSDKQEFYTILAMADSVEYANDEYTKDCMKQRNARLVELSDLCICYYNTNEARSGTGQTYRMALKKGIEIINLYN